MGIEAPELNSGNNFMPNSHYEMEFSDSTGGRKTKPENLDIPEEEKTEARKRLEELRGEIASGEIPGRDTDEHGDLKPYIDETGKKRNPELATEFSDDLGERLHKVELPKEEDDKELEKKGTVTAEQRIRELRERENK